MINEEDHLRIQVMHSGLDLQSAWAQINSLDDQLEESILYAFHHRFGYLTACPTNVGTGLRVSVMLHLPALVITRQIEKVFRSMQRINVTVRGLYGEGSQYTGDFYQVSNQITLGHREEDLVALVGDNVVPRIIEYERKARDFLVTQGQKDLHDDVSRSTWESSAPPRRLAARRRCITFPRFAWVSISGLIKDVQVGTINKLFIHTQPAHLQKLQGRLLGSSDRNVERATYLQRHLSGKVGWRRVELAQSPVWDLSHARRQKRGGKKWGIGSFPLPRRGCSFAMEDRVRTALAGVRLLVCETPGNLSGSPPLILSRAHPITPRACRIIADRRVSVPPPAHR